MHISRAERTEQCLLWCDSPYCDALWYPVDPFSIGLKEDDPSQTISGKLQACVISMMNGRDQRKVNLSCTIHSLHALSHHLAQFPFLGKLAAQQTKICDKIFAGLKKGLAWGEGAIGLDTEDEITIVRIRWLFFHASRDSRGVACDLPEQWMRDFISGEEDVRGLEETGAEHVA